MFTSTHQYLAGRVTSLIEGVCRAVLEGNRDNRCPEPIINLILDYLRRLAARFTFCLQAAPKRPARPRAARPAVKQRAPRILPTQWGWLTSLMADPEPCVARLRDMLEEQDLLTLLKSNPRLGKILRPLTVMLGVGHPPELRLPPTKRAITAAECRQARARFISLKWRRKLGMALLDPKGRPWVRPTLKRWLRSKTRPPTR